MAAAKTTKEAKKTPGAGRRRRQAGRPEKAAGHEGVRQALIDAAAALFAERGYDAVGIREVAGAAGVTPGMISYYFGDKLGLLAAVSDRVFESLLAGIQRIAAAAGERSFAAALIELYIEGIGREPWIAQFMVREVLSRDGPVRTRFVERFASRAAEVAPQLFAQEVRAGRLRRDLNPLLALLSLVGMCVFPFLAHPVAGPLLGYRVDAAFRKQLADHTVRLYLEGAGGGRS